MGRLPPSDEQEWLLAELQLLCARAGWAPFVQTPLRLPTDAFFPDPWTADLAGLDRLCRRLLDQSGLEGFDLHLERFEGDRAVDGVSADGDLRFRHQGAAAWFAGIDGRTVRFGCAEHQLAEGGEGLVGVMAHETAHAWRTVHGLVVRDHDLEELLTDLTTIYLGYGVFTVNNTYRFRTLREERGAQLYSGWSKSQAGYLSPEAMSFAFAAQILCRKPGCWATWRLLRWLEPNQRGHTRKALRHLRPASDVIAQIEPPQVPRLPPGKRPVRGPDRESTD